MRGVGLRVLREGGVGAKVYVAVGASGAAVELRARRAQCCTMQSWRLRRSAPEPSRRPCKSRLP
eukprot:12678271-Alexandrium_andersonii.AAC.1